MGPVYSREIVQPPAAIAALTAEEVKSLQSDTQLLIGKVADRVHYAETRRTMMGNIGGAIFASGAVLTTIAVSNRSEPLIFWPALAEGLTFGLGGLIVWSMFFWQVNRYPFTAATYTWKWFYRDALPNAAAFVAGGKGWKSARNEYAAQLEPFTVRISALKDAHQNLWQDIQQLYTLHINERYKNLHLSALSRALKIFTALAVIVPLLVGTLTAITSGHSDKLVNQAGVAIGSWRLGMSSASIVGDHTRTILVRLPADVAGRMTALWAVDTAGTRIALQVAEQPKPIPSCPGSFVWLPARVEQDLAPYVKKVIVEVP
jgi:hypothetical protein